jgi:hypothetical protein
MNPGLRRRTKNVPAIQDLCGFNASQKLRAHGFPGSWVIKLKVYAIPIGARKVRVAWRVFCMHSGDVAGLIPANSTGRRRYREKRLIVRGELRQLLEP